MHVSFWRLLWTWLRPQRLASYHPLKPFSLQISSLRIVQAFSVQCNLGDSLQVSQFFVWSRASCKAKRDKKVWYLSLEKPGGKGRTAQLGSCAPMPEAGHHAEENWGATKSPFILGAAFVESLLIKMLRLASKFFWLSRCWHPASEIKQTNSSKVFCLD